jgi:hypothetical protein
VDEWEKEGKKYAEKCDIVVSVKKALADAGAFLHEKRGLFSLLHFGDERLYLLIFILGEPETVRFAFYFCRFPASTGAIAAPGWLE